MNDEAAQPSADSSPEDAEDAKHTAADTTRGMSPVSDLSGYLGRIFGTRAFLKLWIAEIISAAGDWLGLLATITLAARLNEGSEGAAIAIVLASRVVPGFFLATAVGVFIDRLSRKHMMVACDLGRAAVLLVLPFVDSLTELVVASFMLELLTMMWQPAKEAAMPNLVPVEKLAAANSLNFIAAYGTFPLASGAAIALAKVAESIPTRTAVSESGVSSMLLSEEGLAFYVDALSFFLAALIISRITIPTRAHHKQRMSWKSAINLGSTLRELREGWRLIAADPIVRAVNVGLATGLMGGGMLAPLGAVFVKQVIGGMPSNEAQAAYGKSEDLPLGTDLSFSEDFSSVLFALGVGMALGVVGASLVQSRLNNSAVFTISLLGAGASLFAAATANTMAQIMPFLMLLGLLVGPVYVLGFTLLHANVANEIRGRVFAALFVLMRLCLLIAFAVAPFLSEVLDLLSSKWWNRHITVLGVGMHIPGVRITLWLAALIIIGAGLLSLWSLRPTRRRRPSPETPTP